MVFIVEDIYQAQKGQLLVVSNYSNVYCLLSSLYILHQKIQFYGAPKAEYVEEGPLCFVYLAD